MTEQQEFLNRLANPERYDILDWIKKTQAFLSTHERYKEDTKLEHWEQVPGAHTIRLTGPQRSKTYSYITTIKNNFYDDYDIEEIEMVTLKYMNEITETLMFTFNVYERNHIPTSEDPAT